MQKENSVIENLWHDSQRVDVQDMITEQNHIDETVSAFINNHYGSGVLLNSPTQNILFDSDLLSEEQFALLASNSFDGYGLHISNQPSDINFGNQLEIELTGSTAIGRQSVKIAIIGLSFDGSLQMDKLYFHTNEKQVTSKHYTKILCIFTNDFKGNNNCSRFLGGRLVIKEAASFQLSLEPIVNRQDIMPDIFWRDFKVASPLFTLAQTIQSGIGNEFSVDALNINTTGSFRSLPANDVVSQIGQKFLATTNNIQKITLLLGVTKNTLTTVDKEFDWSGDLIISIYSLQTSVNCPTDIVPSLEIDFDPDPNPIIQLSYSQAELKDIGVVLNDVAQPVNFVLNSTKLAAGNTIKIGQYYCVTVKRSGSATSGELFLSTGNNNFTESKLTLFSGTWVDVEEESLWYQIWSNAAKLSSGSGYENGNGIFLSKTTTDSVTGSIIDNEYKNISFIDNGENALNTGILSAIKKGSVQVQDERTGNKILSRQQFVPNFNFVNNNSLKDLKNISDPLIIGCAQDTNPKLNQVLENLQTYSGLAKGNVFTILNPDPDLLSLNLIGSKLIPNKNSSYSYKIDKVILCTDGYGDCNGDGIIDSEDLVSATSLIGESLSLISTQQKIKNGEFTTLQVLRADVDGDGIVTTNDTSLISQFINKYINSFPIGTSFNHLDLILEQTIGRDDYYYDCNDGYVRTDGYIGQNIISQNLLSFYEQIYDGYELPVMLELDSVFTTIPYVTTTYQIKPIPTWEPWMVFVSSETKIVPSVFQYPNKIVEINCNTNSIDLCADRNKIKLKTDPGRNDIMIPDNLIIGKGEILRPDGSNYSVDFEVGTIVLELGVSQFIEKSINIFEKFVANFNNGKTVAGYSAMKYSDCSFVNPEDLFLNKVRFGVSLQAIYPNLDGYSYLDGYGVIIDDIIGLYMDHSTGILTISIQDLAEDSIYKTLVTKIQVEVFLKKAGWKNNILTVTSNEVLGLIS